MSEPEQKPGVARPKPAWLDAHDAAMQRMFGEDLTPYIEAVKREVERRAAQRRAEVGGDTAGDGG